MGKGKRPAPVLLQTGAGRFQAFAVRLKNDISGPRSFTADSKSGQYPLCRHPARGIPPIDKTLAFDLYEMQLGELSVKVKYDWFDSGCILVAVDGYSNGAICMLFNASRAVFRVKRGLVPYLFILLHRPFSIIKK